MEEAIQLDLSGFPTQESSLNEDELAQVGEFYEVSKAENGLILQAVAPSLLQISRARLYQLMEEYEGTRYFIRWEFFERQWFSRKELEAFSQLDRDYGRNRKHPSLKSILKQTKDELL